MVNSIEHNFFFNLEEEMFLFSWQNKKNNAL